MRDDRGQALVEFALASVIFFATVFGTLEFGLAIWRYNMVSNLAQEGARWASVHGAASSSPASSADVQTFVQSRSPGVPVTVTTTPAPSSVGVGGSVNVEVESSYTPLTGLIPQATLTLSSRATMIVSR
jgi:Flp pilus assembly protein TadG